MKTPTDHLAADARRLEQAAEWMMRLKADDADPEEIVRWVRWCEQDARNQDAFDRVQDVWWMSAALERSVEREVHGVIPAASTPGARRWGARGTGRGPAWRSPYGLAAGLVLALGAAWLLTLAPHWGTQDQARLISEQGPVSRETLSDGSRVDLATGSAVQVRYTEGERGLELESGEAFFSVERDRRRPFVVQAGGLNVRAVGTAFNVRKAGERVVVTVTEGRVDVFPGRALAGWDAGKVVRLAAGQQLRWDGDDSLPGAIGDLARASAASPVKAMPVPVAARPERALAWRDGRLEYTNEPLHAIVSDLNRYARSPIVLVGEDIRAMKFSGTVLTPAVDEWLLGLPDVFPVTVQRQHDVTVIQRKGPVARD